MLKNKEIIEKLTTEQKLSLINGGVISATNELGIPAVKSAKWEEINNELYPTFSALASSWNVSLMESVAKDIALKAKENSVNLLQTPNMRVSFSPYSKASIEDPQLSLTCSKSLVSAVKNCGVVPCLTECALGLEDIEFADKEVDERALFEYSLRPFSALSDYAQGVAVSTAFTKLDGTYAAVNAQTVNKFIHSVAGSGNYIISSRTEASLSTASISSGTLFSFEGNSSVLKNAIDNYDNLKNSQSELISAVRSGTAISENAVDCTVDKIIDFAKYCNSLSVNANTQTDRQSLALKAAAESIVLLKNEGNILPLRPSTRVAVIGQPAFEGTGETFVNAIKNNVNYAVAGVAEGYGYSRGLDDKLIKEACAVATEADAVILFLQLDSVYTGLDSAHNGAGTFKRSVKLPAGQLALINALKGVNSNIVAVLSCNCRVDTAFDRSVSALLIAPFDGAMANTALFNILYGKTSPSGKLTATYYEDTDSLFAKIKQNKDSGTKKIGVFAGYRNYDTAGTTAKYPFGFGLSYTKFEYKNLEISKGLVRFTVANTGSCDGFEVVQLYVGKADSNVLRPKKELKSFIKIFLKAGESKTLGFNISPSPENLAVYDKSRGKFVIEDGVYEVYVASSVTDVRLESKINVVGEKLASDKEKLSDYLQLFSNVLAEGYTLSPVKSTATNGKQLIIAGATACALSLCAIIIMTILHLAGTISIAPGNVSFPFIIIFSFLAIVFGGMIVSGYLIIKKAEVTPVHAPVNEIARPQEDFEKLFEERLEEEQESANASEDEEQEEELEQLNPLQFVDNSIDFAAAVQQLKTYCAERGFTVTDDAARKIISAFCSSKLILVKTENRDATEQFLSVIAAYMGVNCSFGEINSDNLWSLIQIDDSCKLVDTEEEVISRACVLFVEFSQTAALEDKTDIQPLGATRLEALSAKARGEYTLDEDKCWKKLDKFESFVNGVRSYKLKSFDWQKIEKFVSAYLACGGSEEQALDNTVACTVLPKAVWLLNGKIKSEDGSLIQILKNVFGENQIEECAKILRISGFKEKA